jgi:hypothetical protein
MRFWRKRPRVDVSDFIRKAGEHSRNARRDAADLGRYFDNEPARDQILDQIARDEPPTRGQLESVERKLDQLLGKLDR